MSEPTSRPPLGGLLVACFLGTFNDNAWKMIAILSAIHALPAGANPEAEGHAISTVALVVFTLPLAILSLPAGLIADRVAKGRVIVWAKAAELVAMLAGTAFLWLWPHGGLAALGVLALMGAQTAMFGPAKLGIVPELVPHTLYARANAALEAASFLAIVVGTAAAGPLLAASGGTPALSGLVLSALAVVGLLAAMRVPKTAVARPDARLVETLREGMKAILATRALALAVWGLIAFWALASLLGQALFVHAKTVLQLSDVWTGAPMAMFGIGVGVGSLLVGRMSHGKVELGFVPLGALGLAVLTFALAAFGGSIAWTFVVATLLGVASGFLIVPLDGLLQWLAPPDRRGAVIALANCFVFFGVLLGSLAAGLQSGLGLSTRTVFVTSAVLVLLGTVWALWLLPAAFVRLCLVLVTHTFYRVRVDGRQHVPEQGGALLTPNHVTFVDGLWLLASLDRPVRFLVEQSYYDKRWLVPFLKTLGAIPIAAGGGPRVVLRALREAGRSLDRGELVCIFPEGQLTRTGQMQAFRRGFERIVKGRTAVVVPVYLDRAWGSIFSRAGGRFLFKIPERVPYRVGVRFGTPLPADTGVGQVRKALELLGCDAALARAGENEPLHRAFVRRARRRPFTLAVCDGAVGRRLSRVRALAAGIGLARVLRQKCAQQDRVGVLLPPSVGGAVANLALSLAGKPSVNLNFTTGTAGMASACRQAALRSVVTSREFLAKAGIAVPEGTSPLWIEELLAQMPRRSSLLLALLCPVRMLERLCGGRAPTVDDVATVIFSSGSTGEPKGVLLSHGNVASNVLGIAQVMPIDETDRLLGVLPLFHSFGYLSLWVALQRGLGLVCHPSPLDAAAVGALVERYRVTVLLATPTFLAMYARRCTPEQLGSLRILLAGAEKLPARIVEEFVARFGIRPLEGYGASECAPVITTSTLDFRAPGFFQPGSRPGSVGRALPGTALRVVDPEGGADLPPGEAGLLLVRGPNVMKGYLGRPDLTANVLRDGWYVTGDLARVDDDGFVFVTDRLSRFSKIGGEMVPHGKVEEALHEAAGVMALSFAVAGVPDAKKGERLVVLHTLEEERIELVLGKLQAMGLPNLFVPRREHFMRVQALPLLGTGKLDLKAIKKIALGEPSA